MFCVHVLSIFSHENNSITGFKHENNSITEFKHENNLITEFKKLFALKRFLQFLIIFDLLEGSFGVPVRQPRTGGKQRRRILVLYLSFLLLVTLLALETDILIIFLST